MDTAAQCERHAGPGGERLRAQEDELPAGQLTQAAQSRARERQLAGVQLDGDEPSLRPGPEELDVHAGREHAVVAGEANRRGFGRLRREGDERVDATEQLLAQRPAGRVAEALGRDEGGDGQRLGVTECEVGDARQPGLEAVDDVEASLLEGEGEVRAHPDGDAHAALPGDRHRGADREHVGVEPARERPPAGEKVGRAAGGGEHGDGVPEPPQLGGDTGDVLVHLVRLRPGERRDQADAQEAHVGRV